MTELHFFQWYPCSNTRWQVRSPHTHERVSLCVREGDVTPVLRGRRFSGAYPRFSAGEGRVHWMSRQLITGPHKVLHIAQFHRGEPGYEPATFCSLVNQLYPLCYTRNTQKAATMSNKSVTGSIHLLRQHYKIKLDQIQRSEAESALILWSVYRSASVTVSQVTLLGILRFSTGLRSAMLSWGLFRPCQNKTERQTHNDPSAVNCPPGAQLAPVQLTVKRRSDRQMCENDTLCCV